jgi:hypothetical protein
MLSTGKKSERRLQSAAAAAGSFLSTIDGWTHKYFSPADLHNVDRRLFGA